MISPENYMNMNNNLKVLKLFVDNKDKTFTIKKVAESLRMNYKIVYEEIMKLAQEELINITKHGNAKVCVFNYRFHSKIVEIEETKKEELFKSKSLKLIYKRIKDVKSPFYCLILFGSYANKTNQKGSDIDLCLITDNQQISRDINAILSITPISVHLQEFNSDQFLAMLKSKEFNVGNEIVRNNIILYGVEAFYELVNDVKQ
ncbi:nucleotidyltransferase domain-containing protein [Candidatus Woesearchaeota archaeon]|nr:nucleotidyltransferase domain-containing protein [Candidatus Woesearchaeota archaeon]